MNRISQFLDTAVSSDVFVARRHVPWLVLSCAMTLLLTGFAGLYFGARAASDKFSSERLDLLHTYSETIGRKDVQISRLTDQIIEQQKAHNRQIDELRGTVEGIANVMHLVATNSRHNSEIAARLKARIAELERLRAALQAEQGPVKPGNAPPARGTHIGPPADRLRLPTEPLGVRK